MTSNRSGSENFFPRGLSWFTSVLILLAIGSFIFIYYSETKRVMPMGYMEGAVQNTERLTGDTTEKFAPSAQDQTTINSDVNYPYQPNPDIPVSDTREFLKVYYNAVMRTREVQNLTQRVETTVRGYQGRIDQVSESSQNGFVSFVIPQSKYDAFRTELESLVPSRFITTNISSQNLLPEKQSIEEQQKQADAALAEYVTARQSIIDTHTNVVQALQSKIDANTKQLAFLRSQNETPEILTQIQNTSNTLNSLKRQLASENQAYSVKLSNADNNVKYAQDRQKAVQTQDQALLDNVATVKGQVSIQWISLWDIVRLYLPGYSISIIFTALGGMSLLYDLWRFRNR